MDIGFIIQARLSSTRLPGKVLLPFYNQESILDIVIGKLLTISRKIVIATSLNIENDLLENVAKKHGIICYRGSEHDVLQRFIDAAKFNGIERIIRICSDNPFLELKSIENLLSFVCDNLNKYDYVSFRIGSIPSIKTHYGFWTEYVTLSALNRVASLTDEALYHEHVTNYIYSHPLDFVIHWLDVTDSLSTHPDIRLTIDTKEDFETAQKIYARVHSHGVYSTIDDVINYIDSHPCYYESMKEQISKNTKR